MKIEALVDLEGSFATLSQVFPALESDEPWWLPVNVVLVRDGDTTEAVLAALADEGAEVIVSHFHGTGRFERAGKGFRWAVE